MTEISQELLSEIQLIKWLLIVLVVIGLHRSYIFYAALNGINNQTNKFGKRLEYKEREAEIEEMLAKGDATGAKFTALELTVSYPNEPMAHWHLAKAYDQLGDYIEAKKSLLHVKKIEPSWNSSVDPWLESIEEHLTPKGVK